MHDSPSKSSQKTKWIVEKMDGLPLSRMHLVLVATCALAMFFDSLELSMSNVLGVVLVAGDKAADHSHGIIGMIMGVAPLGGAIGATLLGRFSDARGRKWTSLVILLGFGVTSILAGFTQSLEQLAVMRFASGFFLGAFLPVINVYLVDLLPPANRGRLIMILFMIASFGASIAPSLTHWFTDALPHGIEGWRAVMIFGGIGGLIMLTAFTRLPESPRWLAEQGRDDEALKIWERLRASPTVRFSKNESTGVKPKRTVAPIAVPAADSIWDRAVRPRLVLFCLLEFIVPWAMIGFLTIHGVVFVARGYEMQNALALLSMTTLGIPVGTLLGAAVVDRFPRKNVLVTCTVATAIMSMVFFMAPTAILAVFAAAIYLMFMIIYFQVLMIYGAEIFPDGVRGFAVGGGYTFNRISAFLAPTLLMPFFKHYGELPLFSVFAACMVASGVLIFVFGPGQRTTVTTTAKTEKALA